MFLHLIVLHFLPLCVTNNPGGVEKYFFQTVVAAVKCSFHSRDTVAAGVGTISSVDVVLHTLVGAASRIVL